MTDNKPWLKKAALGASAGIILSALLPYMEGLRFTPYRDVTGIPTVCEGITHNININKVYTEEDCYILDNKAMQHDIDVVNQSVHVPLTQAQIAAFADFVHNEGSGHWYSSTLLKLLNEGHIDAACNQLLRWKYAGKKILPGLEKRREYERQLCLGEY